MYKQDPPFTLIAEAVVGDILSASTLEEAENILTEYFQEMFDSGIAAGRRDAVSVLEKLARDMDSTNK